MRREGVGASAIPHLVTRTEGLNSGAKLLRSPPAAPVVCQSSSSSDRRGPKEVAAPFNSLCSFQGERKMVRREGVEPSSLAGRASETRVYASSTTSARRKPSIPMRTVGCKSQEQRAVGHGSVCSRHHSPPRLLREAGQGGTAPHAMTNHQTVW